MSEVRLSIERLVITGTGLAPEQAGVFGELIRDALQTLAGEADWLDQAGDVRVSAATGPAIRPAGGDDPRGLAGDVARSIMQALQAASPPESSP